MTKEIDDGPPAASRLTPRRVHLPGFVIDEEIGLGDVATRVASYFGGRPCGGCEQRRVALNNWMAFGNGKPS
jgi:hypothetical protein